MSVRAIGLAARPVVVHDRLAPPAHLSSAERAIWIKVVNDRPADSFTAAQEPLLTAYCRHAANHAALGEELKAFDRAWLADDEGLKRYERLLSMSERESRAMMTAATRLRITPQSLVAIGTLSNAIAKDKARARKPWEPSAEGVA